jgi:hypothetical protein
MSKLDWDKIGMENLAIRRDIEHLEKEGVRRKAIRAKTNKEIPPIPKASELEKSTLSKVSKELNNRNKTAVAVVYSAQTEKIARSIYVRLKQLGMTPRLKITKSAPTTSRIALLVCSSQDLAAIAKAKFLVAHLKRMTELELVFEKGAGQNGVSYTVRL